MKSGPEWLGWTSIALKSAREERGHPVPGPDALWGKGRHLKEWYGLGCLRAQRAWTANWVH